jgi:hypothetical protein
MINVNQIESFLTEGNRENRESRESGFKIADSRENPIESSVFSVSFCEKNFDFLGIGYIGRLLQAPL